ncbi:PepSY-associated TM helix domain-containing protein [Sphingomonadaceae bacterium jetA1]|uniref:PepSY-associated TM helix domain-containing protein n=1 Tax=Facivitalis istanbulensis TaxID=3075838 RepID=UPI00348BEF87
MARIGLDSGVGRFHRRLGLATALLQILIALSGLGLLWQAPLERLAAPDHYRISGETRIAPDAYVATARRAMKPGERLASLTLQQGSNPVVVTLRGADTRRLFLDPPTGRLLASAREEDGLSRFHAGLWIPGVGRWLVGGAGVLLLLSVTSGLWRWASMGRARKGRRARGNALPMRWHARSGPWATVPILTMALSGVALAFAGSGGDARDTSAGAAAMPASRTTLSADRAVASARHWSRGRLIGVDWPGVRAPDWTIRLAGDGDGAGTVTIKVADDSASAVSAPARDLPAITSWARRMHRVADGAPLWRILGSLAGLLILWQAATGLALGVRRARR